jgi:cytoskeletal protein CcmA (bactofilin family)
MFKLSNKNEIKDSNEVIKSVNKKTSIPSIINTEMSVKGDLVSDNIIEIFGKVEGNIKSDVLSIREGALVKGNIASKYVKIAGAFEGDVVASIIHITSTGAVTGNLTYGIISIEEKGKFEGSINQKTELLEIKSVEEQNEVKSDE